MPLRVRLPGHISFWHRRLVQPSAELTAGEISLAFRHAMEVCLSQQLQSSVPLFMPYNMCLLPVIVGVFKALHARDSNINKTLKIITKVQLITSLLLLNVTIELLRVRTLYIKSFLSIVNIHNSLGFHACMLQQDIV